MRAVAYVGLLIELLPTLFVVVVYFAVPHPYNGFAPLFLFVPILTIMSAELGYIEERIDLLTLGSITKNETVIAQQIDVLADQRLEEGWPQLRRPDARASHILHYLFRYGHGSVAAIIFVILSSHYFAVEHPSLLAFINQRA